MRIPYIKLPFPCATPEVRSSIAGLVPSGGKITFAQLCEERPKTGYQLLLGFAEQLSARADTALGERAALILPLGTVRHNSAVQTDLHPWHTDRSFFQPAGHGVTFWVTFDDVGETAPSIEFDVDDQVHVACVKAGTALMFLSNVRHRTQRLNGERISVEFRCMPVSARSDEVRSVLQVMVEERASGRRMVISRGGTELHSTFVSAAGLTP